MSSQVLTSEERMVFFPNMDESEFASAEFRPSQVQENGEAILYPCVLYTAVYDHTGRPLASVEIASTIPDRFTQHTIKITRAISLIAASAMRSARLTEEMTFARRQSDALLEISQAMATEVEAEDIIDRMLKVAYDVVSAEKIDLYMIEAETGDLVKEDEGSIVKR